MNDNHFTLTLTTAELLCAATALGLATLPVPIQPEFKDITLEAEIRRGFVLLQQRGLIEAQSAVQWQVDSLVTILTHWLAAPDNMLRFEVWSVSSQQRQATLFFWQTQALWLQSEVGIHQLTIFQATDDWLTYSASWLEIPPETDDESLLFLPPVDLTAILPRLQPNIADLGLMMRHAGLSAEITQAVLLKLATVDRAVTLTWLMGQGMAQKITRQTILLFSPGGMWGGPVVGIDELVVLRPLSRSALFRLLLGSYAADSPTST